MQNRQKRQNRAETALKYLAAVLIIYGTLGVAVHMRLHSIATSGWVGWLKPLSFSDAPTQLVFMDTLQSYYDAQPWLAWMAWLAGVGIITWRRLPAAVISEDTLLKDPAFPFLRRAWVTPSVVLALLVLAGFARLVLLLPQGTGLSERPYDDEGVYAGASQLFVQGIMPYRDYFFAHPPIASLAYVPAMVYHFNEWGSPTSFMMARYLSVVYSLFTLILLFFIGKRLTGIAGGMMAGMLWALDQRVVDINRKVMLDGPMVLFSCVAFLLYLWARPYLSREQIMSVPKHPLLVLLLAGVCATLSALTKIAGVTCLLALMADVVWLSFSRPHDASNAATQIDGPPIRFYEASSAQKRRQAQYGLASLMAGTLLAVMVALVPFLIIAPSKIVRDIFFFQLLRPGDGINEIAARIGDLTAKLTNPMTMLFAALGFILLSLWIWLHRQAGAWRVVVVWMFFSVLVFTYSRSYYQHYYMQLVAPLCLLGAGVSLLPQVARRIFLGGSGERVYSHRLVKTGIVALLASVSLPLLMVQWNGIVTPHQDRIFELVSRYVNNAVPPETAVLATDEQFNFLAGRPPSYNSTGYLIDSYGHMISLGLGLQTRSLEDLWRSVLQGNHGPPPQAEEAAGPEARAHRNDVYGVLLLPAVQADFLDRASRVPLIVLHSTGFNRLTRETQKVIAEASKLVEQKERYSIYRTP